MIGRLEKTVIDCPDPGALAQFYCQPLGMRVNEDLGDWVVIGTELGLRELAFQRVAEWVPPRWPDPAYPQQLHLDIRVDDAEVAERELIVLGATRVPGERETGFRVFTDPAGHPFCIRVRSQEHDLKPAQALASGREQPDEIGINAVGSVNCGWCLRVILMRPAGRPQLKFQAGRCRGPAGSDPRGE